MEVDGEGHGLCQRDWDHLMDQGPDGDAGGDSNETHRQGLKEVDGKRSGNGGSETAKDGNLLQSLTDVDVDRTGNTHAAEKECDEGDQAEVAVEVFRSVAQVLFPALGGIHFEFESLGPFLDSRDPGTQLAILIQSEECAVAHDRAPAEKAGLREAVRGQVDTGSEIGEAHGIARHPAEQSDDPGLPFAKPDRGPDADVELLGDAFLNDQSFASAEGCIGIGRVRLQPTIERKIPGQRADVDESCAVVPREIEH